MPRLRLAYGSHRSQVGDLWLPAAGAGEVPVVMLVHGGFWLSPYTKPLMTRLAKDVAARGWAAWNIEYRRLGVEGGGGGWPATCHDVTAAVDRLATVGGLDLGRIVACGHSAGAQLAFWAAARRGSGAGGNAETTRCDAETTRRDAETTRRDAGPAGHAAGGVVLRGAVSLAGVLDLVEADRLGLGGDATCSFLGGHQTARAAEYALASPMALLPLGVPQVVVHGLSDRTVPAEMSASYCERAKAAGDDVTHVAIEGAGHRDMTDPSASPWAAAVRAIDQLFA